MLVPDRCKDVGRQSGREDTSKTKMALNPRLRLEVFRITVKRPSKVGQRKVHSLVRNRKKLEMSWNCKKAPTLHEKEKVY